MFNEKYRPMNFSDIHGQSKPLKDMMAWINTWPKGKKALLIYGPHGIGKTLSLYVIKNEMRIDLIELNTSDARDAETISRIVGNAARSKALFSDKKIILIDEVDNIKGRADSGGMKALGKIIDETENPIILIANDPYKLPASIKGRADTIRFNTLRSASIRNRLRQIADREGITISEKDIDALASKAGGDMRAAINDLESLGTVVSAPELERLSSRDTENSIFEGLTSIFKKKGTESRNIFFDIDKPPDEIIFWIDENMPKVYHPDDIPCAYYFLSRSDVFLGRVMKRQHYRFWAYAMDLMTSGVSVCHVNKINFSRYESPSYFRHLAITKAKRNIKRDLLKKIGSRTHTSIYDARDYLNLLKMACEDPEGGMNVARYFKLELDELEIVCPDNASSIIDNLSKDENKKKNKKSNKDKNNKKETKEKKPKSQQTSLFHFN